ncbi:MINY1 hydrolase, partial [Columbina picui]|nr:MINY1 hydrolase [Columbina picui]
PHPAPHEQDAAPEPQTTADGASPEGPQAAVGGVTVTLPADPPPARTPVRDADFYCVKWINWKGERTPVVMQSANGPCPLLAIMNALSPTSVRLQVKLPLQKEVITAEELMAHLGDCILSTQPPREPSEGLQLNFQQNINDTMTVLPKLSTGLDVNVRFTGVSDFEYTPECIVFDLLNVPLYHGWLPDPQSPEVAQAVGRLSYNQLVEKIITCKQGSDSRLLSEGLVAEQFLEATASQLTFHGLCELTAAVREGELSVFFRNNHFSTMIKHKVLGTRRRWGHAGAGDTRVLGTRRCWGHAGAGDTRALGTHRRWGHAGAGDTWVLGTLQFGAEPPALFLCPPPLQDYLMALSLQQGGGQEPSVLSDLELARQLQQEEYEQHHPQHPQHPQHPHPQQPG